MRLLLFLIYILYSQAFLADSPITSTEFSKVYKNEKIVKLASKSNGKLTDKLMKYLLKSRKPIELKMAVINELGWSLGNKDNATAFFNYLKMKKNYSNKEELLNQASPSVLICMAYLKALGSYHEVDEALIYAKKSN